MEALQTGHGQVLLSISLLMQIPLHMSLSPTVSGEENDNVGLVALLSRTQCHTDSQSLALSELLSEILAAPSVIDVLVAIITVDGQATSVPSWHAEGWIWQSRKSHSYKVVLALVEELDFIVDCLGDVEAAWVVKLDRIQRWVAD